MILLLYNDYKVKHDKKQVTFVIIIKMENDSQKTY